MSAHTNGTTHRVNDTRHATSPLAAEPTAEEKRGLEEALKQAAERCIGDDPSAKDLDYIRGYYAAMEEISTDPDQTALMGFLGDFFTLPGFRRSVIEIVKEAVGESGQVGAAE